MHRGSDFGFPGAKYSVPGRLSLHTNHFLNLKQHEEEEGDGNKWNHEDMDRGKESN